MAIDKQRLMIYGGLVVVAIAGFVLTSPVKPTESETVNRASKGRSSTKKSVFTEEDLSARFGPVNMRLKNSFVPLVARTGMGSAGGLAPNEFPTSLTSGEKGWFYTGTVIVDDVPSALIENEQTGEGYYLKVGEAFKEAVITEIAPSYIVVSTPNGRPYRMNLLDDSPELDDAPFTGVTVEPVRPVTPTGPIGQGGSFSTQAAIPNEQS